MSNFQQGWQQPQPQQYPPHQPPMPPYQQPPFRPLPDVIYDGKPGETFGLYLMVAALVIITLGIAAPYAICLIHQNEAEHTIVGGRRLRFDGKSGDLFMNMLGWGFMTIISLGICYFWARVEYKKWIAENTHFQPEPQPWQPAPPVYAPGPVQPPAPPMRPVARVQQPAAPVDALAKRREGFFRRQEAGKIELFYTDVGVYVPNLECLQLCEKDNSLQAVILEVERGNEYDKKAIAIFGREGRIGYLYRGKIQDIANDWLKEGKEIAAYISYIDLARPDANKNGLKIDIAFY